MLAKFREAREQSQALSKIMYVCVASFCCVDTVLLAKFKE